MQVFEKHIQDLYIVFATMLLKPNANRNEGFQHGSKYCKMHILCFDKFSIRMKCRLPENFIQNCVYGCFSKIQHNLVTL